MNLINIYFYPTLLKSGLDSNFVKLIIIWRRVWEWNNAMQ